MKMSNLGKWVSVGLLRAAATSARAASLPGDAEVAVHDDESANVQLVKETEQKATDFVFRQYNLAVLSHYSYLIGSGKEAVIEGLPDAPAGFLQGGVEGWAQAGLPTRTIQLLKPAALHRQMQAGTAPIIVDVRLPTEWLALTAGVGALFGALIPLS